MSILLNIINNIRETEEINPELNYSRSSFDASFVKNLINFCSVSDAEK